jgi:hypothetical protein
MVGDPSLCEAVKLIELRLGIVFRIVAHINPVKHELLDLVAGLRDCWLYPLLRDRQHRFDRDLAGLHQQGHLRGARLRTTNSRALLRFET